ncbi:uncharacterized protein [Drosophila takahashii]|uniref:uncharacterized protein n=1 Tax=Drosophila takahashii TaxID=29030 RepID=UPI0007E7B855|nr:uncharacterized protein LOC108064423 [Drosophila takahashii]
MKEVVLYILLMLTGKGYTIFRKTYEAHFVSLESSGPEVVDLSKIRFLGRDHRANGTVELMEDLDNHFTISAESFLDPNGDGEYKQLPFSAPIQELCKSMNSYWSYIERSLKYGENTNFPSDTRPCPLPKGTFWFKDVLIDTDAWPTMLPRGYAKGVVKLFKRGKYMGNATVVAHITNIS